MIFTQKEREEMLWAAKVIGMAANNVQCEVCKKWWDIVSPCALCNATRAFPTYRF